MRRSSDRSQLKAGRSAQAAVLRFFFLGALLVLASPAAAQQERATHPELEPLILRHGFASLKPGRSQLQVFEDRTGAMELPAIREAPFQPVRRAAPSYGFTDSVYWFRFRLENPQDTIVRAVVLIEYPMLDAAELYVPVGGKTEPERRYRRLFAGDAHPFRERAIAYRSPAFPVELAPIESKFLYLRIGGASALNAPLEIRSSDNFARHTAFEGAVFAAYYGALAALFLYNLLVYLVSPDRAYLHYLLYLVAVTLFLFTLNGLAFQYLWPAWPGWANQSLPLWIATGLYFGTQFARDYLRSSDTAPRLDRVLAWLAGISAVLAPAALILPYSGTIVIATFLALVISLAILATALRSILVGARSARIYTAAWAFLLIGIALYSLKTFAFLPDVFWTNWSIQIGVILQVILLSLGLADRIHVLRRDLTRKVQALERAQGELAQSEQQYRTLVESTGDMVFILNLDGRILRINRAIQDLLGIRPDKVAGQSFADLLYRAPELAEAMPDINIQREIFEEELRELKRNRKSVAFKAEFATRLGEVRHLEVKLEYIASGDGTQNRRAGDDRNSGDATSEDDAPPRIFGKAGAIVEDSVARFIESERQSFTLGNYINMAELITQRMIRNVYRYADGHEALGIQIGLREMVINAIEHGNLAVTYDEKTRAQSREQYFEFLNERQKDPRYRDKKVRIVYSLNRKRVYYRIRDEGAGFDHARLLNRDPSAVNEQRLQHGRGLTMTKNAFDVIRYNERGNEVTLVKFFAD